MKPPLVLALAALVLATCSRQAHREAQLMRMLSSDTDDASVSIEFRGKLDLERTLGFLWTAAWDESRSAKEREAADLALAKMARRVLFPEATFNLSKDEYVQRLSDFYSAKYTEATGALQHKAAAIYQRQIREPYSEAEAIRLGMPTSEDLGIHLRPDQI